MTTSEKTCANDCDYTCALRIEGDHVDFEAIDARLEFPGEHSVLPKRRRRQATNEFFARWEFAAVDDSGAEQWSSLADALNRVADIVLPARDVIEAESARSNVHWWCGCFHNGFESSIQMTAPCIGKMADVGAKIVLDNYFSEPAAAALYGRRDDGSPLLQSALTHRYRFTVISEISLPHEVSSRADTVSTEWSNFGEGLSASLDWAFAHPENAAIEISCVHSQFAFDGGPTIEREHLMALARARLGLTIVWRIDPFDCPRVEEGRGS
jgi:hypothetical protein